MLSKTPNLWDPIWTALAAAMGEEEEFRNRVRDAARRVLELKLSYLRGEGHVPYLPDPAKLDAELPSPEGAAFFLDLAARSVTVVRGGGSVIPLRREDAGRVLLAGQYEDFFWAGKAAYPDAQNYWYSTARGLEDFAYFVRNSDTVIFCISSAEGLRILESIKNMNKRVIVFSVLNPAYLEELPWTEGALAVYSYAPESFVAGFSVLLGRIPAGGSLPYE
jgi:beta-N-acetylhexosaminidase